MKTIARVVLGLILLVALVGTAVVLLPGCANTPHSVAQLEGMSEPEFQAWLTGSVTDWATAAGTTVAIEAPDDIDATLRFCTDLDKAADGVITAHAIRDIAKATHFKSKEVALLMVLGQTLLNQRGGVPGGEHGKALMHAIASGIRAGMDEPVPVK